jgi:LacI family transcriptional regulator, galactose operon repressor
VAGRSSAGNKTIVDLAAASGVSVTTVSRILNGKPDVAEETRERVLRVMDEIGFAPQSAWRQIRSGRSRLIGVYVPQEFNPPNLHMIMSAALGVEDAGYSINIITRTLSDADLLAVFRGREIDGMIFSEVLADDRRPELLRDHGYPFVMIGRRIDNTGLTFVDLDLDHAVGAGVEHLVALGHRSIAFLTFDPVVQDKRYGFMTWALDAFERACARHGLRPLACLGGLTLDDMATTAERMLDEHPEVTAVITPQEVSTVGLLRTAQTRGLRIPDDLSIVAMLSEMSGELATPPLTTLPFPADELGRASARMLIGMLTEGQPAGEQLLVRTELRLGGSTAAPGGPGHE